MRSGLCGAVMGLVAAGAAANAAESMKDLDPAQTRAIYAPLHAGAPEDAATERGIAYGPDPRQLMDIWAASEPGSPLVVFLPGGGFVRGSRGEAGSIFYDNVMLWATQSGYAGIVMDYRLAPDNLYPAGQEDIQLMLDWATAHAERLNADPQRIVLVGQSAGAGHVAAYLANRPATQVAGAILISGDYDLKGEEHVYFSSQPDKYRLDRLAQIAVPLLLVEVEFELPFVEGKMATYAKALCERGHCPQTLRLERHNHYSSSYAIGTDDTILTDWMKAFVDGLQNSREDAQ
ncbi:MAG TPA: alpha/beta hydrolase [Sphingomonadaceae bacterium]|nr:alpha/beta hydrolase [Sphingomonadaceae bacterium]